MQSRPNVPQFLYKSESQPIGNINQSNKRRPTRMQLRS